MKSYYSKFTEKKFKTYAILTCLIGDLSIMSYLFFKFTDKQRYQEATKMAEMIAKQVQPQYQDAVVSPEHWQGLYEILVNTLLTGFSLALIIHLFVYYTYQKKNSRSSFLYIRLMAWIGGIGCFLLGLDAVLVKNLPGSYFILQSAAYLFIAKGLGHFAIRKESKKGPKRN